MNADTAAILVTDVVGSSASWERLGDAFRPVLARHDEIVREALGAHQGYEILTEGDSFRVAFPSAAQAAAFANRVFAALRAENINGYNGPLMLRMGLAVGPVLTRPDPRTGRLEHLGPTVHEAVRIGWAAAPGQLLMTSRARADLDAPTRFLGEHSVHGLAGDHALWQLGEADHGPLRTSPGRRGNLPEALEGFIGRAAELAQISALIEEGHRLLTLHGPPGVGKTRLALQAGRALSARLPRAWLCDLTDAVDLEGALGTVGRALELAPGASPEARVGAALASRGPVLLILDNAERATGPVASLLQRWLAEAPELCALVTSRVPLGAPGERVLGVEPLPLDEAAQLFLRLAPALGPSPEVVALVERLDRLPLAIELAAARGRSMTARQMLDRLNQRFRLLSAGSRDAPARHSTLRAALDWSWELLGPCEREALVQLTAFEGGFSLQDGLGVLGRGADGAVSLQLLVDHSLIGLDPTTGRYGALMSVVEHAAERAPEVRISAEIRHGAHFARLGTPGAPEALIVASGTRWPDPLPPDLPNLIAACRRAVARRDAAVAAGAGLAAVAVLQMTGQYVQGSALTGLVLAMPGLPQHQRLELSRLRGALLSLLGRNAEALELLLPLAAAASEDPLQDSRLQVAAGNVLWSAARWDEAEAALRAAVDRVPAQAAVDHLIAPLQALGGLLARRGRWDEGLALLRLALSHAEGRAGPWMLGSIEHQINQAYQERGELDRALQGYRLMLQNTRPGHETLVERRAMSNLANTLHTLGRFEEAAEHLERALSIARSSGDQPEVARLSANLAATSIRLGRIDAAERLCRDAVNQEASMGRPIQRGVALLNLSAILREREDYAGAEDALSDAISAIASTTNFHLLGATLHTRAAVRVSRGDLDRAEEDLDRAERLLREGRHLEELGKALAHRGRLHVARGDEAAARAALAEGRALTAALGLLPNAEPNLMLDELEDQLRARFPQA